jgi:hypothetical protein
LLAADPAPEVRAAAASRCANLDALAAACESETDPAVRPALASSLVGVLSATQDSIRATALLAATACTDAIRMGVARRASDVERRRSAIAGIRDEAALIELALTAEHAETRMAAAERVGTGRAAQARRDGRGQGSRRVRLARKRIEASAEREAAPAKRMRWSRN